MTDIARLAQTVLRGNLTRAAGHQLTYEEAEQHRAAEEHLADATLAVLGDHDHLIDSRDIANAYQGIPARPELGGPE